MGPDHRICDGKRSELVAAEWLLSQGCYVYAPFIEQGPVDLIALSPKGELLMFDVKTVARRENGTIISRTLKQKQQQLGVRLLYVDLVTHECHLYPHQFNIKKSSEQNAGNRRFNGVKPEAISSLLHQESPPQD